MRPESLLLQFPMKRLTADWRAEAFHISSIFCYFSCRSRIQGGTDAFATCFFKTLVRFFLLSRLVLLQTIYKVYELCKRERVQLPFLLGSSWEMGSLWTNPKHQSCTKQWTALIVFFRTKLQSCESKMMILAQPARGISILWFAKADCTKMSLREILLCLADME